MVAAMKAKQTVDVDWVKGDSGLKHALDDMCKIYLPRKRRSMPRTMGYSSWRLLPRLPPMLLSSSRPSPRSFQRIHTRTIRVSRGNQSFSVGMIKMDLSQVVDVVRAKRWSMLLVVGCCAHSADA